jgi:hypothetical protein
MKAFQNLNSRQRWLLEQALKIELVDEEYMIFLLGWKGSDFEQVITKLYECARDLRDGDYDDVLKMDSWCMAVRRYRAEGVTVSLGDAFLIEELVLGEARNPKRDYEVALHFSSPPGRPALDLEWIGLMVFHAPGSDEVEIVMVVDSNERTWPGTDFGYPDVDTAMAAALSVIRAGVK